MLTAMLTFLTLFFAVNLAAQTSIPNDGSKLGLTIIGAIIQKNQDDNVALVKEPNGTVKAIKKASTIMDEYKVKAVFATHVELVDNKNVVYVIHQDKFANTDQNKQQSLSAKPIIPNDRYQEEGFERQQGRVTMTTTYRDKLIKDDLAKILMQASAEPQMENGSLIGFRLSQIDADSIFAKGGLKDGDIITSINDHEMTSVAGTIALLRSLSNANRVDIGLKRNGGTEKITIEIN